KGEVTEVLIDWIRVARLQLGEHFGSDFPVLRLHSDRGGEFSSDLLRAFCRVEGIHQTFTLPASPQKNGIAERRIGMVMDVARASMIHAAAPHFLWPFAVQYAAHKINLQPWVSLPETSPPLRWTGKVGDASAFVSGDLELSFETCLRTSFPPVLFLASSLAFPLTRLVGSFTTPPRVVFCPLRTSHAVEFVKVAVDSGTPGGAEPESVVPGGAGSGGAEPECAGPAGAGSGGAEPECAEPGGAEHGVAESGGAVPACAGPGGAARAAGSASTGGAGAAGPGGARTGGTGAARPSGALGAVAPSGAGASGVAAVGSTGGSGAGAAASAGGPAGAGATGGAGAAGGAAGAGAPVGAGVRAPGAAGGATGAGGAAGVGADAEGAGVVPAKCPPPVRSESQLQLASPLPAPSPYAGPTGGLAECREPELRPPSPAQPARTSCRRVPLPSPPASSLPAFADPESDSLRAACPTVTRTLATVITDPSFESTAASALVAELVDFAAHCRLDYATSLVAESASVCPPSVGGECALSTDVLEDRQEEGDPDAPDIPTPRSYAEAIEGPYSSQWQAAMDAEMASWKSTGTYVDEVPPPGANIVSGMWIFRVKRPPGSPPVFKARYVARGFRQRQGVDYFQNFSPTPKMTTLQVLLHVAAHRDYELHSLDFSTAFLQGSLHEEIWLRRPPGFTGSFPLGTQWSLQRSVYGLRQAPREWHDTLRTTLAALGFAPSNADPSLFLHTDTLLPPFYILVYVDDLVFATADTARPAHVKFELQKRHTCTDLGELRSYLGLQITQDKARRTITLTQSHMVHQVLQRIDFMYSSPQATPLSTRHSLSALPSDESIEPSGPYPELVGCFMYLMTCTRPDLAYPLSILARYAAPGRHRPEHMAATKRVLRYLCSTLGMGLVLGGWSPVVLTGHADASWVDDLATQRCEAEIYAGAMAAQELRWLTYLLTDLGEPPRSPPVLYANTADIFTKALQPYDHERFCTMLACFALFCLTAPSFNLIGSLDADHAADPNNKRSRTRFLFRLEPIGAISWNSRRKNWLPCHHRKHNSLPLRRGRRGRRRSGRPHREAAPQLAAREGDVRPCRQRRELHRANLLPVLLLALLRLLIIECQLGVGIDQDRRLRDLTVVLLVDEAPAQLVGVALLVQPQIPIRPVAHDLQPEVLDVRRDVTQLKGGLQQLPQFLQKSQLRISSSMAAFTASPFQLAIASFTVIVAISLRFSRSAFTSGSSPGRSLSASALSSSVVKAAGSRQAWKTSRSSGLRVRPVRRSSGFWIGTSTTSLSVDSSPADCCPSSSTSSSSTSCFDPSTGCSPPADLDSSLVNRHVDSSPVDRPVYCSPVDCTPPAASCSTGCPVCCSLVVDGFPFWLTSLAPYRPPVLP
ncbi:unnamed protein product, partial [Closterium sp. NIES-53]